MTVISIGDEHARGKFLSIYDKLKDDKNIDFFVCMGDYFDPYKHYHHSDMYNNFNNICKAAEKDKRIILLLGNHDIHYLLDSDRSRYDRYAASMYRSLFLQNKHLFHLYFTQGEYTWSHAGISETWLDSHNLDSDHLDDLLNLITGNIKIEDVKVFLPSEDNISDFTNAEWALRFNDYKDNSGWGDSPYQSCVWIRPPSLIEEMINLNNGNMTFDKQIVGHTRTDDEYIFNYFKNYSTEENLQLGDPLKLNKLPFNRELILVDTGDNFKYHSITFNL